MPAHRTEILNGTGGWVGICSCGFHTRVHSDRAGAAIELADHRIAGLQKDTTDHNKKLK